MRWFELGRVQPTELVDARLQLHWAAQVVAAVGVTLVERRPDDSHTSLGWDESGVLVGQAIPSGRRAAISPASMEWVVMEGEAVASRRGIHGQTLEAGLRWMEQTLDTGTPLVRPTYEMPTHPVGDGAAFACSDLTAFAELGRWFANAHALLTEVATELNDADSVRCWPHHFDVATLLAFDLEATDRENARSIGLGMTPGDAAIPQPYLYVGPWPRSTERPALAGGGAWRADGWAALEGSDLTARDDQRARAEEFLRSALEASRTLLGV